MYLALVPHALVHVHLKHLALADKAVPVAVFAAVARGDVVALAAALAADLLDLLHHAGAQGSHHDLHASAAARLWTVLERGTKGCQ